MKIKLIAAATVVLAVSACSQEKVCEMGKKRELGDLPITTMPWDEANKAVSRLRSSEVTGRQVLIHPA